MLNSKMNLKNKGMILPVVIFVISIFMWLFSLLIFNYSNEVENIIDLKKSNEEYWFLENLSTVAEYELYEANKLIIAKKYKDIVEYFEGKDKVWIKKNIISESGYSRIRIIQNGDIVNEDFKLISYIDNNIEIELGKKLVIEERTVQIKIKIRYKYLAGERNLENSHIRKLEKVEVVILNENFKN